MGSSNNHGEGQSQKDWILKKNETWGHRPRWGHMVCPIKEQCHLEQQNITPNRISPPKIYLNGVIAQAGSLVILSIETNIHPCSQSENHLIIYDIQL